MHNNHFNPLKDKLGIDIRVDVPGQVKITVINLIGQRVSVILNEFRSPGLYRLYWNGHNEQNSMLGNGVYIILMETPSGRTLRKIIIIK